MRSKWIGVLLCGTALLWPTVPTMTVARGGLRAAIGVRDVTPEPLLAVSGGVGPSNPATTKIGRLTVRALVLERAGARVAFCSTDFLGFPGVLCDRVRRQVNGIPAGNILIAATHNHSGPDCYGFPDAQGRTSTDLAYLDDVCDKLAAAISVAIAQLEPATARIATGLARGKIAYNYYAEQLYDPRCDVIQLRRADGSAIATLVNYACHPEVIGPDQGILCPDFVGPLYDRIARRDGGTGIFVNGALGGMVTADCRGPDGEDVQTWDECVRIGSQLADEALRIVAAAPDRKDPTLFCAATTVEFPVDNEMLLKIVKTSPVGLQVNERGQVAVQMNVVNFGDAQILTIPGEALPNIGYYLKRKMQGRHNLLFGVCNDGFGYLLTRADWDSFDRYQYITRTSLGEMTGEIFVNEALGLVYRCPRPDRFD